MMRTFTMIGLAALAGMAGCKDPSEGKSKVRGEAPRAEAPAAPAAAHLSFSADDSSIGFTGSKVTGSHDGGFRSFQGTIALAPRLEDSRVALTIDMGSVYSDADKLTSHLMSKDFFEVATYPQATFTSTSITAVGTAGGDKGATHTITGNLSLHGVEKSISFPATVTVGATAVEAAAEFALNRKDFEISYAGMTDDLIRDQVVIRLKVKAARGPKS